MGEPWVVHCDGSAVPNPGRMGLGAVMVGPDGMRHTVSECGPGVGCNNEAELRALMAALAVLKMQGARALVVHSDSSILVEQLGRAGAAPVARLAPLYDEARATLAAFEQAEVHWIPGHRNSEADGLARDALGLPPRPAPRRRPAKKR